MSSVLNVDTIADKAGSGPTTFLKQTAAKLTANTQLDGTNNSAASFNVSSVAEGGTGLNTVNASSAFSAAKAAVPNITNHDGSFNRGTAVDDASASAFITRTFTASSGSLYDSDTDTALAIHGDLA